MNEVLSSTVRWDGGSLVLGPLPSHLSTIRCKKERLAKVPQCLGKKRHLVAWPWGVALLKFGCGGHKIGWSILRNGNEQSFKFDHEMEGLLFLDSPFPLVNYKVQERLLIKVPRSLRHLGIWKLHFSRPTHCLFVYMYTYIPSKLVDYSTYFHNFAFGLQTIDECRLFGDDVDSFQVRTTAIVTSGKWNSRNFRWLGNVRGFAMTTLKKSQIWKKKKATTLASSLKDMSPRGRTRYGGQ